MPREEQHEKPVKNIGKPILQSILDWFYRYAFIILTAVLGLGIWLWNRRKLKLEAQIFKLRKELLNEQVSKAKATYRVERDILQESRTRLDKLRDRHAELLKKHGLNTEV